MALTFIDVLMVTITAVSLGIGLGIGVGLVHLSALSFMRYAVDYLERLKTHKLEAAKQSGSNE